MIEYSLIIPLFNKADYIKRSLESALNQDSGAPSEIIIVDDGSTDGSLDIVRSINDKSIKIIERGIPGPGGYAARNRGIKEAKFDWIAFLDADDIWYPDSISELLKYSEEFKDVEFFSRGWIRSLNSNEEPDPYYKENKKLGFHILNLEKYIVDSIKFGPPVHTNTVLITKRLITEAGGFPESERRGGDTDLWLRCLTLSSKLGYLPVTGACYYLNLPGAVTTSNNAIYKEHPVRKTVKKILTDSGNIHSRRLLKKYADFKSMDWMEEQKRRKLVKFNSLGFLFYPFTPKAIRMFLAFIFHKIVD